GGGGLLLLCRAARGAAGPGGGCDNRPPRARRRPGEAAEMAQRALMCPQCNGPLSPGRFARSVVCSYCGATVTLDEASVEAARYRRAYADWNAPASHGISSWLEVDRTRWAPGAALARGEISDLYAATRARWPTERALLKVLRDDG